MPPQVGSQRLEEVCQLIDLTIYELSRLAASRERPAKTTLSVKQEAALANEPRLLACFYLLINRWTAGRIKNKLKLTDLQTTRALTKLHRLKLIELRARNRVRLLTSRTIAWRKAGPVPDCTRVAFAKIFSKPILIKLAASCVSKPASSRSRR